MDPIDPRLLIDSYFEQFSHLLGIARRCLQRGELAESAAYVQLAAQYAWFHPTGLLASLRLESILARISAKLRKDTDYPSQSSPGPLPRILHVATEVYGIGGHSRLIWRWMRADAQHSHSLALTRQMESEVPFALSAAVSAAGGDIHFLDRQPGGILNRAQALRSLVSDFDHVVIHAHPWDVIPSLALLGVPNRPFVTHMNKDDHVFFLGTRCADQIVHMRNAGQKLCEQRRGIPQSEYKVLPLPLEVPAPEPSRSEAKRMLGIAEDMVILLSVASAYKYSGGSPHFADVLTPVLAENGNAVLFVIGPEQRGRWASAAQQTGGRIRPLGKQANLDLYLRAADIYLDSFPVASLTSCLESGIHGTPIVSYWYHTPEAETLSADDPALTEVLIKPTSPQRYREELTRLILNPGMRRELGDRTRQHILATHTGAGWMEYLRKIYVPNLHRSDAQSMKPTPHREITELDIELTRIYATSGLSSDLNGVLRDHVGMFPFRERLRLWAAQFRYSPRDLPLCLLSDGQKTRLRLLRAELEADS